MDNNTKRIAVALESISGIMGKVPTGDLHELFKMVGFAYGLAPSSGDNVAVIRQSRTKQGKLPARLEEPHIPLVMRQPLYLPNGQPSAAHPSAQRASNGRPVGLHSFRGPTGPELSFKNEWESEETEEDDYYSPYGSDGDDSINRIGY